MGSLTHREKERERKTLGIEKKADLGDLTIFTHENTEFVRN